MTTPSLSAIGPVAVLDPMSDTMQHKVRRFAKGLDLRFTPSALDADLGATIKDARYVVVRSHRLDPNLLKGNGTIRLIHQWGTGYDGLPLEMAREMGIRVARSPGINAPTVADLTVGLMLATLRRLPQLHMATCAGDWSISNLVSGARDLTGRSVGLIGFGAIGQTVAQRLRGFDCQVTYFKRSGPVDTPDAAYAPLHQILSECDVVSLHLPLTDASRHLIGQKQVAMMKPGAVLINTSRGGLVDEAALIHALRQGQIAGAGLDVFEEEPTPVSNPLLTMQNVVALPHVGGRTDDNLERMVRHWTGNIHTFYQGHDIDPACILV